MQCYGIKNARQWLRAPRGSVRLGRAVALVAVGIITAQGCGGSHSSPATTTPDPDAGTIAPPPPPPFQADLPFTYVAKVKNLLLGLPPTDDEVRQVVADPGALPGLIDGWMMRPEYAEKLLRFFQLAFQQTQVSVLDFSDQSYPRNIAINTTTTPLLVQNAQESFARTMVELVAEHHPLTESATTQTFMMTTALKELYAFLDVWHVDDSGVVADRFAQANPNLTISVGTAQGPIPISETLDPTSPNYMHWYNPDAATEDATVPGCAADPIRYRPSALTLHFLLYGSLDNRRGVGGVGCSQLAGTAAATQFQLPTDFTDWKMVTIRKPNAGEAVSAFYDLPALRNASELVLQVPRVGFFTTPAFFANWQTNISNQARVTMNQTLIVALGAQVDGTDSTMTPGNPPPGLDTVHAGNPACAVCHQTLDPLRSIFAATYSWNYHEQTEAIFSAQKGLFSFHGIIQPVITMADLGLVLAQHPLFPSAWAQKLCAYANSAPCADSDPEFQRIVAAFQASGFDWNTLVRELLSSPISTNTSQTATAVANGEVVAVARRDHLCASLDNRLGFADVCGRDAVTRRALAPTVAQIVSGLPSDGYGRGSTMPVLPNQPSLFFHAGTENICTNVAGNVIDVAAGKQVAGVRYWSSAAPDAAIADFVATVMALVPSDPRAAPATALLEDHFTAALAQGASAADALKSTFVVACQAPSALSIGM
jgi:hypothetical protein